MIEQRAGNRIALQKYPAFYDAGRGVSMAYPSGSAVPAAATALIARMTVPPNAARTTAIINLVSALQDAGSWSTFNGLWMFAAADTQAGKLNWISTSYPFAPNGTVSFAADRGYTGNGTNSSGTFGITYSLLSKYLQNSASVGWWSRTATALDKVDWGISAGDDNARGIAYNTANNMSGRINGTTTTSGGVGTGVGLAAVNRSGATAYQLYKNGANVANGADASTARSNNDLVLFHDKGAGWSTRQLACFWIGGSLTATQHADTYTAIAAYMTAVGA